MGYVDQLPVQVSSLMREFCGTRIVSIVFFKDICILELARSFYENFDVKIEN